MANTYLRTATSLFGMLGIAVLAPTPALAQADSETASGGDEIVVTAQRREELSRDVPITITAIGAEALESAGANQLTDIARVTPALRFDSAATFVQPTIRGVGTAVVNVGGGGNVGIYIDGF
jgi:iron complex outermembrane receptor protein